MKTKWTKEAVFEESRKYRTKADFRKGCSGASSAAQKHGWMKEITWFEKPVPWRLKWTKKTVFTEAKKYSSFDAFRNGNRRAYDVAYKNGWHEEMTWLQRKQIKRGFWDSKDNVLSKSRKYTSMKDFRKGCIGAYDSARKNGWLEEMTWLKANNVKPPYYWSSKDRVFEESKKYTSRIDFMRGSNGAYTSAKTNGWLDEMTWLSRRYKEKGYWDVKENVLAEAQKHTYKSDFHRLAPAAYASVKRHNWSDIMGMFKHKNIDRAESGPIHVVYVYIDEENKKAYVGATNDMKRRDYEHHTDNNDPLYRHYAAIGKELPEYKILVDGLTIIERQREERIQSLYYRDELHYSLLNNIDLTGENVGSIGSLAWKWTRTDVIREAEKYKTPKEFFTNAAGAYDAALRYKMMNKETFPWFYSKKRPQGWWNVKENVLEESKKYKTWDEFFWKSPAAYNAVKKKHKCEDEMSWLERAQVPANYWQNEEHVIEESKKYKTRTEFLTGCHAAYNYANENNLWIKMPWIKLLIKEQGYWTKDRVFEESKKYITRMDFKKGSSTAYGIAAKYHWLDEMTWLVSDTMPRGYWQNKKTVMTEGKKYTSRKDFRWGNPSAYRSAIDNGWLEEMTWLVRPTNYNLKWTEDAVFEESHKYTTRGTFKKGSPSAYKIAREKGWLSLMVWLTTIRKNRPNNDLGLNDENIGKK